MRKFLSLTKYLAFVLPVVGGLIVLKRANRANRQVFPPSAKDILVTPPTLELYGH